jgi:hypothetical protein
MGFKYEKTKTNCLVCGREGWGEIETKTENNGKITTRTMPFECLDCYQIRITETVLKPRENRIVNAEGRMRNLDTSYLMEVE